MAKDKKKVNASEDKKKKHFWKDYRAELKKAYKSVTKFLPKARTRAAVNGALLLSTLTALGIVFFNPSPHSSK